MTVLFWFLIIVVSFALFLALQLRWLAAMSLRRALAAKFDMEEAGRDARLAVAAAAEGQETGPETRYLLETYPRPLAHIRLARLTTQLAPPILVIILISGRFLFGVI